MKHKSITFLFLSFFVFSAVFPQNKKPVRVEIEINSNSDTYRVIPFGEKGVILLYESDEAIDKENKKWIFTLYDVNLKEVWTKQFPIKKNMQFGNTDYDENSVYLFLKQYYSRGLAFQILKLNAENGNIENINGSVPDNVLLTRFKVVLNSAFLGGVVLPSQFRKIAQTIFSLTLVPAFTGVSLKKYQPALYALDMKSGNIKTLNEIYKGQTFVQNLQVDTLKSLVNVLIKNHIPRKYNSFFINEYNVYGDKLNSLEISTNDEKRKLNTGNILSVSKQEKILTGTYNNNTKGNKANPAFSGFIEQSTGLFFADMYNDSIKYINFYNFSDFEKFYNNFDIKRTARLKKKAENKKLKGKEISNNYQLLIHDIIQRKDNYILILEAYYPEYHTVSYTYFDSFGRPMTNYYDVFDGYRYTNALVVCFDKAGKLLWNNSFEMSDIISYNLKERVNVLFDNEDIVLTYSYGGEIKYKIIRGNEVVQDKEDIEIATSYQNDKVKSDYFSDMDYWYDNYFIIYGYQKINREENNDKGTKKVFYMTKMGFQ